MEKNFYIFGEITGQTARDFAAFLNQNKGEIVIHINSPGGSIFDALTISNLIKQRQNVSILVEGCCCSAATLICCSCKVVACKNSNFMIHLPLADLYNLYNAEELQKIASTLEKIKASLILTYTSKLKLEAAEIEKLMAAETYFSAEEALQIGLIDEVSEIETPLKNLIGGINLASNEEVFKSFENSILTAERARVSALLALKNDSPAVNSIINKAIETGKTIDEIKPFIDAIPQEKKKEEPQIKNLDELYKMLSDNLKSGGQNVQSTAAPQDKEAAEKTKFVNDVSKFANEILRTGV